MNANTDTDTQLNMNINTIAVQPRHQDSNSRQHCEFCNAEEGKICSIGGYAVHLVSLYIAGTKKHVCQSCLNEQFEVIH